MQTKEKPAFELKLERVVDAPRERVFEAWTKPEQIAHWFAPKPFKLVVDKMDFRPGGRYAMAMRGPDGFDFKFSGTYQKIEPPSLLIWTGEFTSGPADQIETEIHFEAQGKKTRISVRQTYFVMTPEIQHATKGAVQGWTMTLDQLEGFVAQATAPDNEIVIIRYLDAPRERVWKAMTDPNQVKHWWGPRGFSDTTEIMDVRVGGTWKHIMHGPDGVNYPNKSIYKEIVENERIVYSHAGGKEEGGGAHFVSSWTLETVGDRTKLTLRNVLPDAAAREHVVKTYNAIEGGYQTTARLAEFLAGGMSDADFVLHRVFNAPREKVWKAFTDGKQLAKWWGPRIFTQNEVELEVKPGGKLRITMVGQGQRYSMTGSHKEVVPLQKLVWTMDLTDHPKEWHETIAGFVPGKDKSWRQKPCTQTLTFEDFGNGQTLLSIRTRFESPELRAAMEKIGMRGGWSESLDRLGELVVKS